MKVFLSVAAVLFLTVGCSSVKCPDAGSKAIQSENISRGEEIVQAVVDTDFQKFSRAAQDLPEFPERERGEFQESCKRLQEKFGTPESFRYLGELETPLLHNQLYAVRFIRRGNDGGKVANEQLFQIIFAKDNNQLKLVGMRFI